MNPNDNTNQPNPVVNTPQDAVNSIAPKDEIPMSLEKTEVPTQTEPSSTQPVTSIFTQDLNNSNAGAVKSEIIENKDTLYNYQTNAINPNASVNIDDFRIAEEKNTNLGEISNLESSLETNQTIPQSSPTLQMNSVESTSSPISDIPQTTPNNFANVNAPTVSNNNTIIIAALGSVLALGLVTGAYFVFFRGTQTQQEQVYTGAEFQTEKIIVSQNTELKALSNEEYVTTVKSYIERYNNNIRSSKVKLATPNLTVQQKMEIYMSYSTEILNIYTDLQNLRVPENFKDSHDKLTLSLYALNSLFDTLIIDAKNNTLTPATEKQITDSVAKAEDVAAKAFNEISISQ